MTNPYFRETQQVNQQNLIEDLIIESIKMFGVNVYYLPRKLNNLDKLFGEDQGSTFQTAYLMEMYFNRPEGFENHKASIDKLGFFMPKEMSFLVTKKRFMEEIQVNGLYNLPNPVVPLNEIRPLEGDLIYFPLTKEFFEIKYVDPEAIFYQLGRTYMWELSVEKFVYSQEDIDTGVSDIDNISTTFEQLNNVLNTQDKLADNNEILTESNPEINETEIDIFSSGNY